MSVSKRCKSLVSGPRFYQSYLKYSLISCSRVSRGMVYPVGHNIMIAACTVPIGRYFFGLTEFFPSPDHHHPLLFHHYKYKTSCYTPTRILASSYGLMLSQIEPFFYTFEGSATHTATIKLCVSNPLTKQYVNLPSKKDEPFSLLRWTCGFATRKDPQCHNNIVFKVVLIQRRWATRYPFTLANSITVSIYSSNGNSNKWEEVVLEVSPWTKVLFKDFLRAQDFSHKGILHWFDQATRTILTYDPFDSPDRFGHIRMPDIGSRRVNIVASMRVAQFGHEDEDMIRCCEIERRVGGIDTSLAVWRLDKGQWCLERRCEISSLCSSRYLHILSGCGQVIASEPACNPEGYSCTVATRKQINVIHLESGKKDDVDIPNGMLGIHGAFDRLPLAPFTFSPCPWF